jgi:hypothetical protein
METTDQGDRTTGEHPERNHEMNTEVFDGIVREMGEVSTRRNFFRFFSGAAALTAGLALGGASLAKGKSHGRARSEKHTATAERRGNNGLRITICYKNQTRNVKKRGYRTKFPGATLGACPTTPKPDPKPQPQPTTCENWILSGGPSPSDMINVDDDLRITANGVIIINDNDFKASQIAPKVFNAPSGSFLQIRAIDQAGPCRSLSPLWVHCIATGQKKEIYSGVANDCVAGRGATGIFVDGTFQISL